MLGNKPNHAGANSSRFKNMELSAVLPAPESAYHSRIDHLNSETMLTTPTSPGSAATPALASRDTTAPYGPDLQAVNELLGTMKLTLSTLGVTFDTLSDQTVKLAALGPAISAIHQVDIVRKQLADQQQQQEERMQGVKRLLSEELKTHLRNHLTSQMNSIVKEVVQREVENRVRQQLTVQIPESLRKEVLEYKRQILEVKTSLHNSEARRHNALIRSTALDEPLRPLLRPLSRDSSPCSPSSTRKQGASSPKLSDTTFSSHSATAALHYDLHSATPSPLFPRDIANMLRLEPDTVRTLMKEYGLMGSGASQSKVVNSGSQQLNSEKRDKTNQLLIDGEGSREENVNRFMSFIGVGLQLVPSSPTQGKQTQLQSPLVARASYPYVH
ncbi:hypothetical protein AcV5_001968 [Taiwanofungus camphoratus]|nr:hypothetical protein AcV5_001968 [Antrodia cinnamomea]